MMQGFMIVKRTFDQNVVVLSWERVSLERKELFGKSYQYDGTEDKWRSSRNFQKLSLVGRKTSGYYRHKDRMGRIEAW